MEFIDFYNSIQNPIDNYEIMNYLLTAYSKIDDCIIYRALVKCIDKNNRAGASLRWQKDQFQAMLFNKWKSNILSMTKMEYVELYRRGKLGEDFVKMRNYLKNVPDVSTEKEAREIVLGKKGDKELEDAFEKYCWDAGNDFFWTHVISRNITAKKDPYPQVEHRLYLNVEINDIYKIATLFIKKCEERNLIYYFKYDEYATRDDTIVIYSSSEDLFKYLEILREIQKEYPDIVSRTKHPPVLSGVIDGWIGYGSEPRKKPNGDGNSFNKLRAELIAPIIDSTTKKWILDHLYMQITYNGKRYVFVDFIAKLATESLFKSLEKNYYIVEDIERKKPGYNPQAVIDRTGYSLDDLKNPRNEQYIYRLLCGSLAKVLPEFCRNEYKGGHIISVKVKNNKQINFSRSNLTQLIHELSLKIAKHDYSFIPSMQAQIKNECPKYGIDHNKFCFDFDKEQLLEQTMSSGSRFR